MNGDNKDEVGDCTECNRHACDFFANGHGEECLHCERFYCYRHQDEHSSSVGRDPLTVFPKTYRRSFEILSDLSNHPTTFQRPKIAINHGLFLAKKLKDSEMERSYLDMLSMMDENKTGNITSIGDMQSDIRTEMTYRISHELPRMLKSANDRFETSGINPDG
jgi:hypothetical protein